MSWLALLPKASGLDHLIGDFRYALRGMRRSPAFYGTAVAMLALGIGINAAIFSVFSHVLLAPLHFADPDSLYVISSHAASLGDARRALAGPDFRDIRDQNTVFSGVAAVVPWFSETWTGDGPPRVVRCASPTQQFFSVIGVKPVLGRLFTPEEYTSLHNNTVLISWNFWKREFNGDPTIIGRSIRIEDVSSTIVGVLPPMSDLYPDTDIWFKLTTEPSWEFMNWRANKFLDGIARLKPGVSRSVAEQQLTSILRRAQDEPKDVQVHLTPLKEFIVGRVTRQLNIVMAAVVLVLLVTCMNTAMLLLSRAVKRSPELAVRLGLGASRTRIRQQLLVEGLLLSSIGGALGIALASMSVGFVRQIPGLSLPRLQGLHLNLPALFASIALVILTSIVFAILPAGMLSRLNVAASMHSGRTETGYAQRRPFSALIIAEIACAVVLAICAGLLVRSFVRVRSVDLGFQPARVLTAYLRTNYYGPEGYQFWHNVLNGVAGVPGVTAAAASDCMPATNVKSATILFSGRPNDPKHAPAFEGCWISSDYFHAVGSSLLRGRFFTDHDNDTSPPVVVINAEAAERFFPGEDPIGKRIAVSYLALGTVNAPRMREIVGIVSNLRQRALDLPTAPAVYVPYLQDETHHVLASMNLFVRSAGDDPGLLANSIRAKIQSMYPDQPVERVMIMTEVVSRSLSQRTYSVGLLTAFAGLALVLCALGMYGVISYVTLQRTREFGIRMAVGATRQDVLRNVLRQGGSLVATGVVLGMGLSLLTTRALSQLLFETTAFDPIIFASVPVMLGLIGVLACLLPGIRASRLDPRAALNSE